MFLAKTAVPDGPWRIGIRRNLSHDGRSPDFLGLALPEVHTPVCRAFAKSPLSSGMIVTKCRCWIKHGLTTMRWCQGHDRREVRTYTLPSATCAPKAPPLDSVGGFRAPSTHDKGPRPLTLPNPARVGCAPGISLPGPGLGRALPLRDLPRRDFRVPAPTASVSPPDQDGRCRRAIGAR